ncbi:hypothetical protein [Bdellovibrio sp. HCB2-146]|uniref:hypothetical protein n=1 Tax=Bdellovibrio sp. HCB2-146 TaxID=3394362 RepID=UPI0039BD56A1
MTHILLSTIAALIFTTTAQAATLFQCAVNNVVGYQGARVSVIQNAKGQLRANLIFGTTVSGKMYALSEIAPGIFQGTLKGKGKEKQTLKLFVSNVTMENNYIRGYVSQLEVSSSSGQGVSYKSSDADGFVCGKKIHNFR